MSESLYYKIPRSERWLAGDSPAEIGGRDTDLSQLGMSLRARIGDLYPINEVPQDIHDAADALVVQLAAAEAAMEGLIELVSADQLRRLGISVPVAGASDDRSGS